MRCKGRAKGTHLDAKVTSVDVVSEKQVPRVSRAPTDFKEFHEVVLGQTVGQFTADEAKPAHARIAHGCHHRLERW